MRYWWSLWLVGGLVAGCAKRGRGASDGPIDVTSFLDQFLTEVNEETRKAGKTELVLGDLLVAGFKATNVTLWGLDSLVSRGPATLTSQDTVVRADVVIGLASPVLSTNHLEYGGVAGPANISIGDTSLSLWYTVDLKDKTKCVLTWGQVRLHTLSNVTVSSPVEGLDHADLSSFFTTNILPLANKRFTDKSFKEFLQANFDTCKDHLPYGFWDKIKFYFRKVASALRHIFGFNVQEVV